MGERDPVVTAGVIASQTAAAAPELVAEQAARRDAERAAVRIRQLLAGIGEAFVACLSDWRIEFANAAGSRLLGGGGDDLTGRNLWETAPSSLRGSRLEHELRRAMADQRPITLEEQTGARGEWLEWNVYPLSEGGVAFYARDITARKGEEELRTRTASYASLRAEIGAALATGQEIPAMLQQCCQAVVKHLPMAFMRVWLLDSTGTWLDLRASAGQYTHLDGPHCRVKVGSFKIGLIAAERKPHLTNAVLNDERVSSKDWARREGMVAFVGFPLLAGDVLVGVLAGFSRVRLPEDTMTALGGVSDAVAQGVVRRRAEIELDERVRDLARSNADLEQFAYVASHDLQEPLRIVASYTQLLARRYKGRLDQDADEFIAFAVDGVTRMQRLITDLLTYSRVGTRGREFMQVSMEGAFAAALNNLRQAVVDAKAQVTHDPLPVVVGDEGQLVQLLQNLVGNALKFRGAEPPLVHVGVRPTQVGSGDEGGGPGWTFTVRDNGVGIEPQYFPRIFVIFQRLHSPDKYPGTGIGLALCKKIVERHGGHIWVESELGKGATFLFSLPAGPPQVQVRPGGQEG